MKNANADSVTSQGIQNTLYSHATTAAAYPVISLPALAGSTIIRTAPVKMKISGLSSETFALTGSTDGTNYSPSLIPINAATGQYYGTADLGNATFHFPVQWNFKQYKLVKSSTAETGFVAISAVSVPK
jgi:hypothetical protein